MSQDSGYNSKSDDDAEYLNRLIDQFEEEGLHLSDCGALGEQSQNRARAELFYKLKVALTAKFTISRSSEHHQIKTKGILTSKQHSTINRADIEN